MGGGGGLPHPVLDRKYPIQSWPGGSPLPGPGMEYPPHHLDLGWGTPPSPSSWMGYSLPGPGMWYPPHQLDGVPPHLDLGWGTPLWNVNRQTPVKTPSLVLRTRVVNMSRNIGLTSSLFLNDYEKDNDVATRVSVDSVARLMNSKEKSFRKLFAKEK